MAAAVVAVAEAGKSLWRFDVEVERAYEEGRGRGAPPLDRLPSRRGMVALVAGIGALRGLGFALVRPALPRRPEAAALVYSMLGAASLATGVQRVHEALFRGRSDMTPWPSAARVIRAWLPAVIWRATVTSTIERLIARRRT